MSREIYVPPGGPPRVERPDPAIYAAMGAENILAIQTEFTRSGAPTENGKFAKAVRDYLAGSRPPERVRVYEKIRSGIWVYSGLFYLIDY